MVARGHEIVGEAETAASAYSLLAAEQPDAAIVDLALREGSGHDLARRAAAQGCRVIVFSAFVDSFESRSLVDAVVDKPDFQALEAAIDMLSNRATRDDRWREGQSDRRQQKDAATERPLPTSPVEEPAAFYQALGEAVPGDILMFIDIQDSSLDAAESLAAAARGVIRAHDRLMRRDLQLSVLLVDCTPEAPVAVAARLTQAWDATAYRSRWVWRHTMLTEAESPADAYQRLRSPPA
ncbi:MAG: Response regulator receiver domain [Acidimicrobiaceae bacterium]